MDSFFINSFFRRLWRKIVGFVKNKWQNRFAQDFKGEETLRQMGDKSVHFTDESGRKIKISPADGLQAEDAEGTIIHDTPDCLIASGLSYGGHIYFNPDSTAIETVTITYTDTQTDRTASSSVTNTDLSPYLPSDLTNAKAAIILVRNRITVTGTKVKSTTYVNCITRYSFTYNTAPSGSEYMNDFYVVSQSLDADNQQLDMHVSNTTFVPIIYEDGVPYITTQLWAQFANMVNANNLYYANAVYFLMGFLT